MTSLWQCYLSPFAGRTLQHIKRMEDTVVYIGFNHGCCLFVCPFDWYLGTQFARTIIPQICALCLFKIGTGTSNGSGFCLSIDDPLASTMHASNRMLIAVRRSFPAILYDDSLKSFKLLLNVCWTFMCLTSQ